MPRAAVAPSHLSLRARRFYRWAIEEFDLGDDLAALAILRLAAEALDEAEAARALVKRDGEVVIDRFGQPKENPASAIGNRAALRAARLVRELALPIGDGDELPDARLPRIGTGALA